MKYQLFRDYNSLSKRTKILAGVGNAILGIIITVALDTSMGLALEDSLFRVGLILGFAIVFLFTYGWIQKRRTKKN